MTEIIYASATSDDLPAIRSLLTHCRLPPEGIEAALGDCIAARVDSRLVGVIALEVRGRSALLRSLAVAPDHRGHAVGRGLVEKILGRARMAGIDRVFLLTTDADTYFESLGFKSVERAQAPPEIAATGQFSSVCPASAACMVAVLS